ncbi:type III secretion system cytoplasmic ring protein SctQ [Noviherbaspirillum pedocola]|uniref:Type III secretion system cytoplasmic ring protein SctQ n=1 Tax=Noviherbaspirillum pedocola TaxID=2801341 RepID=A0A934SPT4_9BURK|nr:type III secretion system cytoplasmic ring protein SctQ [Noviherbaspirillum pedocola]MBK4733249.1 type III secretion system cytoplasmic ring protein SctQ [Noviherbaspirillum pedocola]
MSNPLALPRLTSEYVAQRNAVFRRRIAVNVHWLDQEWVWTLQPLSATSWKGAWIKAEWGTADAYVTLPDSLLLDLANAMLRSGQLLDLPPALRLAVAETAFSALSERVEAASRRRLRMLSLSTDTPEIDGLLGLAWEMSSARETHTGELWLSQSGMGQLASGFTRPVHFETIKNDLSGLPIPIRFCAGRTVARMSVLSRLAARDLILFDETWITEDGTLTIALGRNAAYRGIVRGTKIEITEGPISIMEDDDYDDNQQSDAPLDDLPVRICFDLGERTLPLHELQSLSPGFIFDLGRDLRRAVQVRANGMLIGEGQLVDIEGRIGVVVTSLGPSAERLN